MERAQLTEHQFCAGGAFPADTTLGSVCALPGLLLRSLLKVTIRRKPCSLLKFKGPLEAIDNASS